ncbi:hypothetical protein K470DRAFT_257699 [Piedraia hortae CBS 480.64]|uniref:Uncharacterized protein n=1 Tax=Piedraia hortae CBS 480.64 TaxID=1314780 RepID=A0A6A7BZK2_9PEZI|nr:hypothetical protein K470DRAFT_257699 [Piedraia hortae CBS 480.64]
MTFLTKVSWRAKLQLILNQLFFRPCGGDEEFKRPVDLCLHIGAGCYALAEVAQRLAITPASSVPSEPAFSILSLIHNSLKNLLLTPKFDKL